MSLSTTSYIVFRDGKVWLTHIAGLRYIEVHNVISWAICISVKQVRTISIKALIRLCLPKIHTSNSFPQYSALRISQYIQHIINYNMPILQLRTYTLKTASYALAYAARWKPTMSSIAKYNVTTRGVYLNETNPKQVIAIVEFRDGDDPAAKIEEYAKSDAFKVDLGELDMSCFESVDPSFLKPTEFSPGQ